MCDICDIYDTLGPVISSHAFEAELILPPKNNKYILG